MLHFLLFSFLVNSAFSLSCPQNYALIGTIKCVRLLQSAQYDPLDDLLPIAREDCSKDGAHLPIIRSSEENEMINHIVKSMHELSGEINLVLGLVCNNATHRLEWVDGSSLTYIPDSRLEIDFDCAQSMRTLFSKPQGGQWYHVLTDYNMGWPFTVICIAEPINDHTFF